MRPRLRILKHVLVTLFIVFLLVLASISTLVETHTGSRIALSLIGRILPLDFVAPRGDLLNGLDMERLEYQKDGLVVEVINPSFRWRPVDALFGTLTIHSLSADAVNVRIPPSPVPTTDEPFSAWPNLRLPVRVELAKMAVGKISVSLGDNDPIEWQSLSGSFSIGTFYLRYQNLALEHLQYGVTLTGASLLNYPYTTDARVKFRVGEEIPMSVNPAGFPYHGEGLINGGLEGINAALTTSVPVVIRAEASSRLVDEQRRLLTSPQIALNAEWKDQTLPQAWWVPNQPTPITTGKITVAGNLEAYDGNLIANLNIENLPPSHIELNLRGTSKGAHINHLLFTDDLIPVALTQIVPSQVTAPLIPFGAAVNQTIPSPVPSAKVKPVVEPPTVVNPAAQRLEIEGDVEWLPALKWDLATTADNINFATFFAEFKSNLDFTFSSQGEVQYSQTAWQVAVNELKVDGILRDQTLTADGSILGSSSAWRTPGFNVVYGSNQAKIRGRLDENSAVEWQINAPKLAQLYDAFSGSINTRGQLIANPANPKLAMTLVADKLKFAGYDADELLINMQPANATDQTLTKELDINTSTALTSSVNLAKKPPVSASPLVELRGEIAKTLWSESLLKGENYQLEIKGRNLHAAGLQFNNLAVNGRGGASQHTLNATIDSLTLGDIKLATTGSYKQGAWLGKLSELDVRLPGVPRWWLIDAGEIRINADKLSMTAHCLTTRGQLPRRTGTAQEDQPAIVTTLTGDAAGDTLSSSGQRAPTNVASDARLCITATMDQTKGLVADIDLKKAPIRQLYAAFNPEVSLVGTLNGSAKITSPMPISLMSLKAEAKVGTDGAGVNYQYAGGEVKTYLWERTGFIATLNKGQLDAKGQINWTGYGALNAAIIANLQTMNIKEGRINADFTNIAPFETFFINVNDLTGSLAGSFQISGALNKPQLSGSMALQNGSASILSLGITPTKIGLMLQVVNNDTINLRGEATSNKGELAIDAQLEQLSSATWKAGGTIRGTDFRLLNTPQLVLNVSPDLYLGASADAITIRGETIIPYGRANLKTLPESSIKVSEDVVIIDSQNLPEEKKVPWPVELNVTLKVGDDVKFNGFGLKSTLGGSVVLFKEKDWTRPLLNGFVSVTKGSYKAYGQSLNIERGRLIFQGSYDNPGLDIRASRDIVGDDSTQVGLEITGTLQRPAAKVYSTPLMSDSEAMMMLLTGRPIKDASSSEATLLLGALTSLGDGGEGFTEGLAGMFNVDEFGINANNGIEQSELWVGKYLTPKLLVRYVVGLFDQLTSIGVEYQINERFRVEAKSGEAQSVDLIYKYER